MLLLSTLYFADGPWPPAASICLPTKTHAETHQVPASSQGDHDDYDEDVDGDNSRLEKYLWLWRNSQMW